VAVESAGPYVNNLHLAPDRKPHNTSSLNFYRCSFQRPTNSVKALKAHVSLNTNARYSLYFTMGFSETPKMAPYKWRIQAPSETWFVGDTKVQNANGMSIGSSISAQTALVTDRQTDTQT